MTDDRRDIMKSGRRSTDEHCSAHEILWGHHEQDKSDHRNLVCAKIADLKQDISKLENDASILRETIVSKYWFRIIVGFLCAGIAAVGVQQNWAFKEIISNQKEFAMTINNFGNKQGEMSEQISSFKKELDTLSKRQDILRDRDLKHIEEFHKNQSRPTVKDN